MKQFHLSILLVLIPLNLFAQREFIHPGITYTQADLNRMKAMVNARREPFYSTYLQLAASSFAQSTVGGHTNVTAIPETQHNNFIGMDGRKAHDNALMWKLTGTMAYADNAVKLLNGYLNLTNSSSRGTGPLDNGKIYMLIEAAELMRDYSGWETVDQEKFKSMLVHPGYSTKVIPTSHYSLVDSLNDVTIYWNIYNFDRGRFGNQGLFAARGLMAMGIYLDNDTIYDRALRYLSGLPHRSYDLPYNSGPAIIGSMISETELQRDFNVTYSTTVPDYGYDELLKYYIYENGQCQESSRDQGHTMGGIGNYTCIAEMAWNQGDSLYNILDNRILKGIEFNTRYNLSTDAVYVYPDQTTPWEPVGYSTKESDCTYDNGIFYQAMSRSGRWFGKKMSPIGRSTDFGPGGWREQALAHYKIRMGVDSSEMKWLQRSHDRLMGDYGFENWGVSGHHYEWFGWGTLTKRRTAWMAGDGGTFVSAKHVSGLPVAPCIIRAVDYDYFNGNGEGRTYHNDGKTVGTLYRTNGSIEILQDGTEPVVTTMIAGEWMNYTMVFPAPDGNTTPSVSKKYNIYVTYQSAGTGAKLFAAVDDGIRKGKELLAASQWTERCLGTFTVNCGANVVRIYVKGNSNLLKLKNIRVEPIVTSGLGKVPLKNIVVKVFDASANDLTASYSNAIDAATDSIFSNTINLGMQKFLVYDFGINGLDLAKVTFYNDGITKDGAEQAVVLGSTKNGPYTASWTNTGTNVLRTNASIQNGIPILDNTWSSTGLGRYQVGPVGKYRYLGVYNWSRTCKISELEVESSEATTSGTEDMEASAIWDNTDEANVTAPQASSKAFIMGGSGMISCIGANQLEAYSLSGVRIIRASDEKASLPAGFYIVKAILDDQTVVSKVIVR